MNCGANCVEQCLFVSAIVIHSLSGYKMFAVIRKGVTVVQSWRDSSYDPSWHSNGLRWIKSVIFSVYGEFSCYQWHQRIKWLVSSMETVCRTGVGPVSIPRDAGWQSPEISEVELVCICVVTLFLLEKVSFFQCETVSEWPSEYTRIGRRASAMSFSAFGEM